MQRQMKALFLMIVGVIIFLLMQAGLPKEVLYTIGEFSIGYTITSLLLITFMD